MNVQIRSGTNATNRAAFDCSFQSRGLTPFPGNAIPPAQINPVSHKVMDLFPLPKLTSRFQNNYYADAEANWVATTKLNGYARLSYLRFETCNDPIFGPQGGGVPINGVNSGYGWGHTWNGTLAATYVLSPAFILPHGGL